MDRKMSFEKQNLLFQGLKPEAAECFFPAEVVIRCHESERRVFWKRSRKANEP